MLEKALLILLGSVSISKAIRFISHSLNGNQPVAVDDSSQDNLILTQTESPPATKYDVFMSFRGEDTRYTFARYLYNELRDAGIRTFMDHELHKGEQISAVLLRTIAESKISVIIFSENYASSTWCMDELVHILKCMEDYGRVVIPIFYKVNPSNIRKQNGSFGTGFDVLKQRSFNDNQGKLKHWRNALIQSASLSGWDSNVTRPEPELVEEIVKDILSKLKYKSSSHLEEGFVGIAPHIVNIEKLLREDRIVGIWGMGGAGKTTLAKALFHELKSQFDTFSFIENVEEKLKKDSLDEIQKNCLKELLKDGDISIYDITNDSVKSRLRCKKVLLILDDVDKLITAKDLTTVCNWFGEGSRIIITSRNEQVLKNASTFSTYHVPNLDLDDAFLLFCLNAFRKNEPSEGFMELSKSIVEYCEGNPLTLKVLGCSLYGRGKQEWESYLENLKQAPPDDIVEVLKLSFDGLDDKQQSMFLDLAFLIKQRVRISLKVIRQLYGSPEHYDVNVLREKSLISFDSNGYIVMHSLVRKMGLEINRQPLSPGRKNSVVRLWRHEDIYRYFNRAEAVIEAVRCMSLDVSKMKEITWRASDFRKMYNLIYLKVYKSDWRKHLKLNLVGRLDYLPKELRHLIWEEYPRSHVPLCFCAENLVKLSMPNSNIRQLGNGSEHFPNLEEIDLGGSKDLIAVPDLSYVPKIKNMYLRGCESLAQIHSSSTVPGSKVCLLKGESGPVKINIGGSIKGTSSSGLVIVRNYLSLREMLFKKVTMKVLACGKIISGVGFKHVVMPLAEKEELREGIQSLGLLLPFVRSLEWLEGPIKFGHDFNHRFTSHHLGPTFRLELRERGDRRERSLVGPLIRRREMINDHEAASSMGDEDEEEEEDDELIMEDCGSNILARVPRSIPRWSLLTGLTLKESEIMGNAQVSILKSLSHDDCKRIQPLLDATLSFNTPLSALPHYSFLAGYSFSTQAHQLPRQPFFGFHVLTLGPPGIRLAVAYTDF